MGVRSTRALSSTLAGTRVTTAAQPQVCKSRKFLGLGNIYYWSRIEHLYYTFFPLRVTWVRRKQRNETNNNNSKKKMLETTFFCWDLLGKGVCDVCDVCNSNKSGFSVKYRCHSIWTGTSLAWIYQQQFVRHTIRYGVPVWLFLFPEIQELFNAFLLKAAINRRVQKVPHILLVTPIYQDTVVHHRWSWQCEVWLCPMPQVGLCIALLCFQEQYRKVFLY